MITPTALTACERLDELSACAYRLGERFGAEAERAPAGDLKAFELFERCFFAIPLVESLPALSSRKPCKRLSGPQRDCAGLGVPALQPAGAGLRQG